MAMTLLVQTVGRHLILTALLIAAFLMCIAIRQQDWVNNRIEIKYSDLKDVLGPILNSTASLTQSIPNLSMLKSLEKEQPDAAFEMKTQMGLQQVCVSMSFSGFGNPTQHFMPTMQWCFERNLYTNPEKYGLPRDTDRTMIDKVDMNSSFICMVIALTVVLMAIIVVFIKPLKWPIHCLIATLALCLISAICVVAAISMAHGKGIKDDFDRYKSIMNRYGGSQDGYDGPKGYGDQEEYAGRRKRRDDGSAGYGDYYRNYTEGHVSRESVTTSGAYAMAGQQFALKLFQHMEMKESFGCPVTLSGVAIAFLLLAGIFTVIEFIQIRKSGESDVKYQNVALT